MKLKNPLLVVTDLERSVAFYKEVLGLRKIMDFGANVTLTGGLAFHFAAFRRQVAAEVKGHLPLRVSFLPLLAHAISFPVAVG